MHDLLRFDGRTIALTGAASGIGAATLDLLNATDAAVHAIDLAPIRSGAHTSHHADLGDPVSVAELVKQLPASLDVLVNCAGLPNGGRFTPEQIVAVNWFGLRLLTESVLPKMPEGSAVVHVASTAARNWRRHQAELAELLAIESFDETMAWVASHGDVVGDGYAFSKEAVWYYTLQRSASSLQDGVRMNCVSPGVTDTPIAPDFVAGVGADAIDQAIATAGRIAQPEEMAPSLLFLADEPSSSFINGVNLTVDRGVKAARTMGEFPTADHPERHAGSAQEYDVVLRRDVGMVMPDGATLFADIYFPALEGEPLAGEWPVLLERTPYDKGRVVHSANGRFFAKRGYVAVVQDVRGRYSSDGEFEFLRNEADDGDATMEWLAAQDWCGPIGTLGISYTTATQQALAVRRPEKLATQALFDGPYNYFRQTMRHGGACEYGIAFQYVVFMARASKQAAADPVVRSGLDDMWASLTRWLGHRAIVKGETPLSLTPDYEQWFFDMLTTSDYTDYWISPGSSIDEFIDDYPDIPLLLETSWFGHHITATLWKYEQLTKRHRTPKQLIIGTWLHGGDMFTQSVAGDVEFGADAALEDNNSLRLRWFDHHLKGLPTGIDTEAPVRIFVMGGGSGTRDRAGRLMHGGRWRDEHEWPLARAVDTRLYFRADGALVDDPPETDEPPTTYSFDPTDPVPTVGGNFTNYGTSGFLEGGGYDQISGTMSGDTTPPAPLEDRPDVIVFRTPPLADGVEVTGVVTCTLWVSSSAVDTDFTVKLIDEYPPNADYPNGYALNLGDSILRMRYRDGFDQATLMEPGEIYEVELRLQATSNFFAAGHCIRVDVSSSNFPHYDINPNTGEPLGLDTRHVVAHQAIYTDAKRPSGVVLPVIPS